MRKLFFLSIFFITVGISAQDIGGDYYVDPNGSDSNPGTYTKPWATWQHAFDMAQPGDTVYFRGGVYYNLERLEINPEKYGGGVGHSGTKDNPIVYMGYPGEWPILDCSHHCDNHPIGSNHYNAAIALDYVEHIIFKDFEIRNVFQCDSVMNGAISSTYSRYLTFDHIIMHNVGERGYYIVGGAWQSYYEDGKTDIQPYWPTSDDTTRWINCDTYHLMDSLASHPGNAADAWKTIHYRDNVLIWENCRAWDFTDDGIDPNEINGAKRFISNCWIIPRMTFTESTPDWDFEQNGIKGTGIANNIYTTSPIGDSIVTLYVNNCIVAYAKGCGFYLIETGEADHRANARFYNNIAYKCTMGYGVTGNAKSSYPQTGHWNNNIEYASTDHSAICDTCWYGVVIPHDDGWCYPESHNTWDCKDGYPWGEVTDTVIVTDADFIDIDSVDIVRQLTAPRKADGSLPDITVFHLAPGSDLIDGGIDVGLPYLGKAPDLGPFEYDPGAKEGNLSPSIKITKPVSGSTISGQDTDILIEVDAADPDGSVSKVEFFQNDTIKIGESNSSPWSYTWIDAPSGTYTIRASATDNAGATTTSARVYLTKEEPRELEITGYSPNPTSGKVTIVYYSPVTGTINIKVVNSAGTQVLALNDDATEGENNQVDIDLTSQASGTYTITLDCGTSSDSCSVTKEDEVPPRPLEIISSTSETFDIFIVSFYSPNATNISIEIFNSSGNSVMNTTYPANEGNNETSLDISGLPEGEYRVTLYDGTTSVDCYVTKKEKETILFELVEASPDPTVDLFEIKFNNPSSGTIHAKVFNDAGKKVWEDKFNVERGLNKSIVLNLSSLDPGNYKVTVDNGKDPELTTTVTRQAYINE